MKKAIKALLGLFLASTVFLITGCGPFLDSLISSSSVSSSLASSSQTVAATSSATAVSSSLNPSSSSYSSSEVISSEEETSSEFSSEMSSEFSSENPVSSIEESSSLSSEAEVFYTVRFVDWDGKVLQESQVKKGEAAIFEKERPSRKGDERLQYDFQGWDKNVQQINSDLTVNALYDSSTAGIGYTLNDQQTSYVVSSFTSDNSSLTFFHTYHGLKVSTIKAGVFSSNDKLKTVFIHSGIVNIEQDAFYDCPNLVYFLEAYSRPSGWPSGWPTNSNNVYRGVNENGILIQDDIVYVRSGDRATAASALYSSSTDLTIQSQVNISGVNYQVTNIGYRAIAGAYNLHSLTLPYTGWVFHDLLGTSPFTDSYAIKITDTSYYCASKMELKISSWSTFTFRYCAFQGARGLKSIQIPEGVSAISNNAFSDCSQLQEVILPSTLETIESEAFSNCTSLVEISLPSSLKKIAIATFMGCSSLRSLLIPSSVEEIGPRAFEGCASFTSFVLGPDIVINQTGGYLFKGCTSLKELTIDNQYLTSVESLFSDQDNVPLEKIILGPHTFIEEGTFRSIKSIKEIVADETNPNFQTIEGVLFSKDLKTLICYPAMKEGTYVIPSSVTEIAIFAFCWCPLLTELTIPNNVTTIAKTPFLDMVGLKVLTIDFSGFVTLSSLFSCSLLSKNPPVNLKKVILGTHITSISENAFLDTDVEEVVLLGEVTEIGNCAFYKASSLKKINLPESLLTIGKSAFSSCTSLETVSIPTHVTLIGDNAFNDCDSLVTLTIPSSVTQIGGQFAADCQKLESLYFYAYDAAPFGILYNFFSYCPSLTTVYFDWSYRPEDKTDLLSAFRGIDSLAYITIGPHVKDILTAPFIFQPSNVPNLVSFNVDPANEYYSSHDGVLYSKDGTVLLQFPNKKTTSYQLPSTCTAIGPSAFFLNNYLTQLVIPETVTVIQAYAFYGCSYLTIFARAGVKPTGWAESCNTSAVPIYWYSPSLPSTSGNFWHYVNGVITKW